MAIVKRDKGLTLKKPGLQRINGAKSLKAKREPLSFVKPQPNPLSGKPDKNQEKKFTRELDEYGKAFREAALKEAAATAHATEGYGADYFVVVFKDSRQCTAYLQANGYPDAKDVFVDGTILADLQGIQLPDPLAPPPKKLKTVKQTALVELVTRKH